jgi:hypothetical protein
MVAPDIGYFCVECLQLIRLQLKSAKEAF